MGTGFDSIAFLPFLLNCMCIFLNSYLYRSLASFQFIFSEDCSTYRSIPLCVSVGEVELHVFLLHHLFFPPKTSFFWNISSFVSSSSSIQPRRLVYSVWNSNNGTPCLWLQSLTPQGRYLLLKSSLFSEFLSCGHRF